MMKIRKVLKLVYWLIFQDGIEKLQNRMEEVETRNYGFRETEKTIVSILQIRVTVLEKQMDELIDTEVLARVPNAT